MKENFRNRFRGSRVKMHTRTLLHFFRGRQQFQTDVNSARLAEFSRGGQYHPAFQRSVLDSCKIHGGALARRGTFHTLPAGLYAADP